VNVQVCARNLVITLLQRCMPKPVAASSAGEIDVPVSTDPVFEWVCLLFRALFRAGHSRNLYNAVGAHMLSRLWSRVTPEQLILLRMFSLWVDHVSETQRTPAVGEEFDISEARALVGTFEFIQTTWAFLINSDDEDRPDDVEPVRKLMWIELENESKLLLLDVLGELTVSSRHQLTASNEDTCRELLSSVFVELRRVWQLRQTNPKPTAQAKSGNTSNHGDQQQVELINEPEGYRSRLIRVAGNLCFRNTTRQDLVRDEGFIPLVLAHCNIDEHNPLIREWALVALRNLCEGNEANQQYIDAMRPQNKDGAAPAGESKQSE
jgi:ataxin-10